MEDTHLRILRHLVRALKPNLIIETGVANGTSTNAILETLEANHTGTLWSYDVRPDLGSVVDPKLKPRWQFRVLPRRGRKETLTRELHALPPPDIFLHDSNHSYSWQLLEYELAFEILRPGGLLLSDDIDSSYAMIDFARRRMLRCVSFVGTRKLFGAVVKPSS